ncbi:hypothetical protein [Sulfitobacter sp. THAF37]|uniref:hypothetical protein n=1 Tax=Sulfitobacter sp. THAF37 TaxID=2587855 RepID=UPI0012685D25|nr:hypothetical protein [Sulfitobacter sp. THAF37]
MGLLAMLAASDNHTRKRRWLEEKLWSDRASEQARGSLRTTLVDIRKSLGNFADILGSDRSSVWLDSTRIETDLEDSDSSREFLEGLVIPDPEFTDWLMRQRMTLRRPSGTNRPEAHLPARVTIQCGEPWNLSTAASVKPQIVNDQVGKIITDFIAISRRTITETTADLVIRTSIEEEDRGATILVQVIDPIRDEIVHTDHCFADDLSSFLRSQELLGRFCWNVADLTLEKLPGLQRTQSPLVTRSAHVQKALRKVLTFDAAEMRSSLEVLDLANDEMDAGLYLALKAWAMTSMIMEGFLVEDAASLEEISALLARAEELSPGDPMMAAVSANVQAILFERHDNAIGLARRALRENPNNLFALQAMSVGRAARGELEQAYALSQQSKSISALSKFEAMCNLHHALLCISLQRTEEAVASSKLAAERSPAYRAPRRQLIGLHAAQDKTGESLKLVNELKTIETDFNIERYLFDHSYPSNTLRKSGYLDRARQTLSGRK